MEVLSMTPKYHSPAAGLYSAITAYLGLKPYEHEYKVMGMSPYGQSKYCIDILRPSFSVQGLEFRNHTGHFGLNLARYFHRRLYRQRFDNVCAATQELFEELMVTWVKNAIQVTGVPHVCAAGGAFLNVKANQKIRELPEVQSLSVYPASDDGGTPVGAAILGTLTWAQRHNQPALLDLPRTMHLGLKFTETQIEQAILRAGLPLQRMSHPARDQAAILAQGLILARFQGREELGPRALGNRSIVADPRDLKMIRKLNFAIKQRDFWMPFAASILEEDMPRYIQGTSPAPYYMIESFPTTPLGFHDLIAGIHPFDRTIRPQVVNDIYPEYREMIQEFKMITGVGGVLNTSFNLHGFPIVGTPDIAIETYQRSAIDALAIGPFLLRKPAMEQA
jgi:carbamoyltransferase